MPLSLFQFLNLLKQRVHFFVFAWASLEPLQVQGLEKSHLDQILTPMSQAPSFAELRELLAQKKLEVAAPILLVDQNGIEAKELARQLDDAGFLNVFYALDGVQGLEHERSSFTQ